MNRYQRAREMAGYTQKELASKLGLKPAVISRYESEEASVHITPSVDRAKDIAEICGVSVPFLTEDAKLYYLDEEQAERFRNEISAYNDELKRWPKETEASFGTTHPFLYMLKDRWEPSIEDVEYVERKFGINGKSILYSGNRHETDVLREKNLDPVIIDIVDAFKKNGFLISLEEAKTLAKDGVIVLENNTQKELYLNVDAIDSDVLKALIVMIKSSRKGLRMTPVRGEKNKYDVWEKAYESVDGQSSGWWARGMDMSPDEAGKLVDAYHPEIEKPSQDPEDPETADSNIQK